MKKGFIAVTQKEFAGIFSNPRILVILILPIILFSFYGLIFSRGVPTDLPVAIIDQDHSVLSREFIRDLDATSMIKIDRYVQDEQQAIKLLRTEKVYAFLLIPDNFQKDIFRGKTANAMFYENNDFLTPGGMLSKAFLTAGGEFSASLRVNALMQQGHSIHQAGTSVQPIRLDSHILFNPYTNYSYYLGLALMPMSLQLLVMLTTIYVLGKMLKNREGKELYLLSGENVWAAFWGKMIPFTVLFIVIAVYMLSYLYWYMGIPMKGNYFTVLSLTILLVLVYQLMALFFVSVSKEFRTLATIAGGYSSLSFSFVGYTFPADGMPKVIQAMDYIFPFSSYARMYINIAVRDNPFQYSLPLFTGLMVFSIIGLLSLPRFRKILQKGGYDAQTIG